MSELIEQVTEAMTTEYSPRTKPGNGHWQLDQRIFCVEHYFRTKSFKKVKELFCQQFSTEIVPHKTCIQKWVAKFRKHGCLTNLPSPFDPKDKKLSNKPGNSPAMSSQKGNTARSRAQKHQNSSAFKNNLHDKSKLTKVLNSLQITDVCYRCKAILEWKIKYKKYKMLKHPGTCVKCKSKNVTLSYRTMCQLCADSLKVCPKCGRHESEWNTADQINEEELLSSSDNELDDSEKDNNSEDVQWNE